MGNLGDAPFNAPLPGGSVDSLGGRLQQTTGLVPQVGNLVLNGAWQDCPSATVTFTPSVACYAIVVATFSFSFSTAADNFADAEGTLSVDGSRQPAQAILSLDNQTSPHANFQLAGTVNQNYRIALTAASHTLKLQAIYGTNTGNSVSCDGTHTNFLYWLVAQ